MLEAVTLADSSQYGSVLRTHRLTRDYEVLLALAPLTLKVSGLGEHGLIKPHNLAVAIDGGLHILTHRLNHRFVPSISPLNGHLSHVDDLLLDQILSIDLTKTPDFDKLVRKGTVKQYGSFLDTLCDPCFQGLF